MLIMSASGRMCRCECEEEGVCGVGVKERCVGVWERVGMVAFLGVVMKGGVRVRI